MHPHSHLFSLSNQREAATGKCGMPRESLLTRSQQIQEVRSMLTLFFLKAFLKAYEAFRYSILALDLVMLWQRLYLSAFHTAHHVIGSFTTPSSSWRLLEVKAGQ